MVVVVVEYRIGSGRNPKLAMWVVRSSHRHYSRAALSQSVREFFIYLVAIEEYLLFPQPSVYCGPWYILVVSYLVTNITLVGDNEG